MRILIVLSSLTAEGTPVLALEMGRVWKRQGADVRVATLASGPAEMSAEFSSAGLDVVPLEIDFVGRRKFPAMVRKVRDLCRGEKPDGLVCFPFGWHSWVTWGARLAGVRRFVAHAGNYPPFKNANALRKLRMTLRVGEALRPPIACCSEHVREGLIEHLGLIPERLHTIHNGIDLEKYAGDRSRPRTPGRPIRIGMVARFEPHKDQPTLISAAALLAAQGLPIEVDLVGDGSRREEYRRLIDQLGVADFVRLAGMRRDVPELLKSWDMFAYCVTEDEGLGIALIEAAAAGVPIVAADVGACREVLGDSGGQMGRFFPVGDSQALVRQIHSFIDNPRAWLEGANEARKGIAARFSIESMASAYLKVMGLA